MKKIAILNNKGGVGKSTVAVQLSHGLAKIGYKVLLLDLDGQGDCGLFLGFSEDDYEFTFDDVFDNYNPAELTDCIIEAREGLDLLPSINTNKINSELHQDARIDIALEKKLEPIEGQYDFIFIDCGPSRTRVNDAVLCYVDNLIMPIQVEAAAVRGAGNIYDYLDELHLDPGMISLVIPNMYDQRTNEAKKNLERLKSLFGDEGILTEPIHRRVRITEAGDMGKTVFEHDEEAGKQFMKILERVVEDIV